MASLVNDRTQKAARRQLNSAAVGCCLLLSVYALKPARIQLYSIGPATGANPTAVPESQSSTSAPPKVVEENPRRPLLEEHLATLKLGRERFRSLPDYTATFFKRERLGNGLSDGEQIELKVRHSPFGIYMRWITGEPGKEALFVDGVNDGNVLVRLGGLKGKFLPAVSVNPLGSLAQCESRHPVTHVGVLALTEMLIRQREQEFRAGVLAGCRVDRNAESSGRPCSLWTFEFDERAHSPLYRKSVQYVDREWNAPLEVWNYTWPDGSVPLAAGALDDATLIEYYKYSDVKTDFRLSDTDFDRANPDYHFHR